MPKPRFCYYEIHMDGCLRSVCSNPDEANREAQRLAETYLTTTSVHPIDHRAAAEKMRRVRNHDRNRKAN